MRRKNFRDGSVCPCCEARVEPHRFLIDVGLNLIVFNGKILSLQPRMTEFVSLLWAEYPRDVLSSDIMYKIYGAQDGPEGLPREILSQLYGTARNKLNDMGVEIISTRHGPRSTRRLRLTRLSTAEHPALEDLIDAAKQA